MKQLPQYLRGIAAVFVVIYHANLKIGAYYHVDLLPWVVHQGGGLAFTGVNVFFALSGYLMSSLVQTSDPGTFIWHRAARIYPAFFIAVAVCVGAPLVVSGRLVPLYLPALTLFPSKGHGPLGVEWTLAFEMTFYVISALFCFARARRFHGLFMVVWALALIANTYFLPVVHKPELPQFYQVPFADYSLSFVLGGIAFYAMRIHRLKAATVICGPFILLATLLYAMFFAGVPGVPRYTYAVLSSATVAYAFTVELHWRSSLLMNLGNRSYGVYLIHQPLCSWLLVLFSAHIPNPVMMYAVLLVGSISAGWILGGLDLAIYRRLKGFRFRPKPAAQDGGVIA